MMTERVNSNPTYFRIFSTHVVSRDKRLNLVAHPVIDSDLARDGGAACSFSTTTSFEYCPSITSSSATQLSGTFTPGKRPVQLSFECFDRRSLIARDLRSRAANVAR
jgi:hypothetical protein